MSEALFAKFSTSEEAAARLAAENSARNDTYFAHIYPHDSDTSVVMEVDDSFVVDERLPHAIEPILLACDAANTGYDIPHKDYHLSIFEEEKLIHKQEVFSACAAYELQFFSGPAHSIINSLNDVSLIEAIHENDGNLWNVPSQQTIAWINGLWLDYFNRSYMIDIAERKEEFYAITSDFSSHGSPPHNIATIQHQYNTLMASFASTLPGVPPVIKNIHGV